MTTVLPPNAESRLDGDGGILGLGDGDAVGRGRGAFIGLRRDHELGAGGADSSAGSAVLVQVDDLDGVAVNVDLIVGVECADGDGMHAFADLNVSPAKLSVPLRREAVCCRGR